MGFLSETQNIFFIMFFLLFAFQVGGCLCHVTTSTGTSCVAQEMSCPWWSMPLPLWNKYWYRTTQFSCFWQIQVNDGSSLNKSRWGWLKWRLPSRHRAAGTPCLGFPGFGSCNLIHLQGDRGRCQCAREESGKAGNYTYTLDFCGGNYSWLCVVLITSWSSGDLGERDAVPRTLAPE